MPLRSIELGPSPFMRRWKLWPYQTMPSSNPTSTRQNGYKQPPQPFLRTGLGKLPPEIREVIWEDVLSSQEARVIDADVRQPPDLTDAMSAVALSEAPPPSMQDEVPCPALLQVCRMVYQEAQNIYYAETMFRFTDASSLTGFLNKIGKERRLTITVLRLGGLTIKEPTFSNDFLDEHYGEGNTRASQRESLAAMTSDCEHPKVQEAVEYLKDCKHLKTIHLDLKVGQESLYIFILFDVYGFGNVVIDFLDTFHWAVRWAPEEFEEWLPNFATRAGPQGPDWGDDIRGNDRLVEVDVGLNQTLLFLDS